MRSGGSRALLTLAFLQVLLWCGLFLGAQLFREGPNGKSLGVDFAVFLSGAQVIRDGGNPYDPTTLYATEHRLLGKQHIPVTSNRSLVRLGNPPLLYWALQPLIEAPFPITAIAWIVTMYGLSAVGFLSALAHFGWQKQIAPLAIFMLMPQVVIGAAYGNITAVVFAAIGVGLALASHFPALAGAALVLTWLKPQLGLPVVLLMALFLVRPTHRFVAGFAIATAVASALSLGTVGWTLMTQWGRGLFTFSGSLALQPNLASLSSLYVSWAPDPFRAAVEAALFLIAMILTWRCVRQQSTRAPSSLPYPSLYVVWFLCTPYAHFPDEIVLAIPLLALVGPGPWGQVSSLSTWPIYVLFFSILLFPSVDGFSLLAVPLIMVALGIYRAEGDAGEATSLGRGSGTA